MRVIYYQDRGRKWRWRLLARNNRIVASSGEAFYSLSNARRSFDNLGLADVPSAEIRRAR